MRAENIHHPIATRYVFHVRGPVPNDTGVKVSIAHVEAILNQSPISEGRKNPEASVEDIVDDKGGS